MWSLTPQQITVIVHGLMAGIVLICQTYYSVVFVLSALIGVVLVGFGVKRFATSGSHGAPFGLAATEVFLGAVFINLTSWINGLSLDLLNQASADSPLNYSVSGESGLSAMVTTAVVIVEAVGAWGVVRGLWLFKESHYDRRAFWSALTHTIFGCLALNFTTFVSQLDAGMGGALSSTLAILGVPTG